MNLSIKPFAGPSCFDILKEVKTTVTRQHAGQLFAAH